MVETALKVKELIENEGMHPTLVNARFVKPIDTEIIDQLMENHSVFVTMEENVLCGGFGEKVLSYIQDKNRKIQVLPIALPDAYVEHGNVDLLKKELGIDADTIAKRIKAEVNN